MAFEEAAYRTPDLLENVLAPGPTSNSTRVVLLDALSWGSSELRAEVSELGQSNLFGKYDPDGRDLKQFDEHMLLNHIQSKAPVALRILQSISEPLESSRERQNKHTSRWTLILAILCFTQRRTSSTNLPTILGLHFYTNGVKAQEIDLLAKFGITISYKTVM